MFLLAGFYSLILPSDLFCKINNLTQIGSMVSGADKVTVPDADKTVQFDPKYPGLPESLEEILPALSYFCLCLKLVYLV
jgi:hypothetical protein